MSRRATAAFATLALVPAAARAAEYSGRVMLGGFQQAEKLEEESAGQASNDRRDVLGRLYFDVTGIGPFRNQLTLDLRDRYAEFGRVDDERLVLAESNEPRLRQLALKHPYEAGGPFWSLGRMPVPDAGVDGVDGLEAAFRVASKLRLGLFGGLIPQRERGRSLQIDPDARQAGVYATYQNRGREWFDHMYVTNALVAEQTLEEPEITPTEADAPPIPELDPATTQVEDEKEEVSALHFFHSGILQPGKDLRITSLAYLYLTPKAYLRNGALTATRQFNQAFSGTLSVLRIDLQEYRRTRDVRERLAASDYSQTRADLKHKVSKRMVVLGGMLYGVRGRDGLSKAQAQAGVAVSQLAGNRLATSVVGGFRKNFESRDTFLKLGLDYYRRRIELNVDQQFIVEERDDGETLHPKVTGLTLGYMIGDGLIGSVGGEYAKDERATVMSGLVTISYRFGNRQLNPPRTKAPPPERVGTEML
jgi:hypothetical protein